MKQIGKNEIKKTQIQIL